MSEDPFPGSSADFYERIQVLKADFQKAKEWNKLCEIQLKNLQEIVAVQDAEIERLKQSKNILSDLLYKMEAKANRQETLIAELCDALEGYCWDESGLNHDPEGAELIQRAREAHDELYP